MVATTTEDGGDHDGGSTMVVAMTLADDGGDPHRSLNTPGSKLPTSTHAAAEEAQSPEGNYEHLITNSYKPDK